MYTVNVLPEEEMSCSLAKHALFPKALQLKPHTTGIPE